MYSEIICNKDCIYQKNGYCYKTNTKINTRYSLSMNCEFYFSKKFYNNINQKNYSYV